MRHDSAVPKARAGYCDSMYGQLASEHAPLMLGGGYYTRHGADGHLEDCDSGCARLDVERWPQNNTWKDCHKVDAVLFSQPEGGTFRLNLLTV